MNLLQFFDFPLLSIPSPEHHVFVDVGKVGASLGALQGAGSGSEMDTLWERERERKRERERERVTHVIESCVRSTARSEQLLCVGSQSNSLKSVRRMCGGGWCSGASHLHLEMTLSLSLSLFLFLSLSLSLSLCLTLFPSLSLFTFRTHFRGVSPAVPSFTLEARSLHMPSLGANMMSVDRVEIASAARTRAD